MYIPQKLLEQAYEQARELDRPLSWVLQAAFLFWLQNGAPHVDLSEYRRRSSTGGTR